MSKIISLSVDDDFANRRQFENADTERAEKRVEKKNDERNSYGSDYGARRR